MFVFFFFKQKTAYEMRISDWSSDVCSSDLAMVLMAGMDLPLSVVREHIGASIDIIVQQARLSDGRRVATSIVEITGLESGRIQQIGRASCRERVCQYV